jgi:protein-tyrosine-phosphatase/catechol 2,3-dioxygenase-like lactoylglutathione lyase family enzyme
MTEKPSVLFVCVHNAGRSQMAAALLSHLAGDRVEVRSAGTEPADQINPAAVAVMAEWGIDITDLPKVLTAEAVQRSDVVITMGCGDTCPYFPGVSYRDWQLRDPAGQPLDTVRAIREDIAEHVRALIEHLLGTTTPIEMPAAERKVAISRVQLALNVNDLEKAIGFYTRLFGVEPAKIKPGYANFVIAEPPLKLVLLESPGHGGTLNHLGVEVATSDAVLTESRRLSEVGVLTDEEIDTTCCFAAQDKVWVTGPSGERWEIYTVKADSETFGPTEEPDHSCCAS